jgi:putative membrane protein
VFLVTYLLHHAQAGSVPFNGKVWYGSCTFAILIPHILLATVVVPLALFTIYRGWTNRIALHKKVARITLPIWLYVSVSGVVV